MIRRIYDEISANYCDTLLTKLIQDEKQYDNTIDEMQLEIEILKEENERLRKIVDGKAREQTLSFNDGIITRGKEADFYPNEVREIVMDVLKSARTNLIKNNTRRADVIDDIIEANPVEGTPGIRAKALQTLFKGYSNMDASIRKKLNDLGISCPAKISSHHKASYYDDNRYKVSISASCSDRRGGNNTAAEMTRKFL
jgi:FtsZ-binding cell division protein ZapB